jgi:hypothetical protein
MSRLRRLLCQSLKVFFLMCCILLSGLIVYYQITGNSYYRAYGWIRQSAEVTKDTGRILRITPAREKDCWCAFGDGCNCDLYLRVEGENGTGVVSMADFDVNFPDGDLYFGSAFWEWDGKPRRKISRGCRFLDPDPGCRSGVSFW